MKKMLLIMALLFGALFGALPLASATIFYTNDWGSVKEGPAPANNNAILQSYYGWTVIANSQNGPWVVNTGEYIGTGNYPGANDPANGLGLPSNAAYMSGLVYTNQTPQGGMIFTTNGAGPGLFGDSAFTSIVNPASISNLTLNVEFYYNGTYLTNYFAVQVGGQWYAETSDQFPSFLNPGGNTFTNVALVLTNSANVWSPVTIDSSLHFVTIGSPGSPPNFSQTLTGIGIIELCNTSIGSGTPGGNYSMIVINQGPSDFPNSPATNTIGALTPLGVYAGGGVTFAPSFTGTPTLVYRWQTNGVNIGIGANVASSTGSHYLGAQTTLLIITNVSANDALLGITNFSVVVTNFFGKATNSGITLNVITPPPGLLYAELFPLVGSDGGASLPGVGWAAASSGTYGIFSQGGNSFGSTVGGGTVFDYAGAAATNVFYTTITNDPGLSGLPFRTITNANYPTITFQCAFSLGGAGALSDMQVHWAVQMRDSVGGTNWYYSASPIQPVLSGYLTNQFAFSTAATNWNNMTIVSNVATLGGPASGALAGKITGAGLVIVHTAVSDMNFENFEITTNAVAILPPVIGTDYPIDVGVPSGGGASFGVATVTGSQPFGYYWKTNGDLVNDGGRVSGATTATLTIANLNANDNGMQIIAFVTNSAGTDESDSGLNGNPGNPTTLTVTNGPVGEIYLDEFPFVGPVTGNYPIGSVGWSEAVSGTPFPVFRRGTAGLTDQGDGAVFAFFGSAATNVYYTTTATDTNQAGLPFPNINLASYPSLNISVDIAPFTNSANVTAFLAVQLNGANWYVAASALPVPKVDSSTYATYTIAFNPAAANWKNLTVTPGTGGTIGSTAASNLKGVMTGAGLVFVTVGAGGTLNFDNFLITGTGVGGINVGPLTGGNVNLTWVGNPAVRLQSTTNLLSNWQDVPNTLGLYSQPVSVTGPQKFFRLKTP
jgi:hypothetical protein